MGPGSWYLRGQKTIKDLPVLDRLTTLPLLTLVLLLLHAPDNWYLRVPLVLLTAAGVSCQQILTRPWFWYTLATLLGATVYLNWAESDNHRYLFIYWSLTLCAAFTLPAGSQEEVLTNSSRWLIGLCMLLATAWKVVTPDYMSGAFFTYELLADERFAFFATCVTGVSSQSLADNRELIGLIKSGYLRNLELSAVQLEGVAQVATLATFLTWWTVLIEGLLALLFLWPDNRRIAPLRNACLILFAATTYSVANVRGFGWMLMLLGIAQCPDRDRRWRWAYLAGLLLIQAYMFPLSAIVQIVIKGVS